MTISTKRHILDSNSLQPQKLTTPYPLHAADSDATICLITADPQRAYKNIVAGDAFPAVLRERITRVVDLAHLTKKFKSYEAQRKLFAEHDIFLADDRIINRLPKALGKTFYKSTVKRPIPVVLAKRRPRGADGKRTKAEKQKKVAPGSLSALDEAALAAERATEGARPAEQIAREIQKAVGAVVVHLAPTASTAIKVALAGWPATHVAANVEAVCREFVGKYVPQQWNNVRTIFIKGPRTMAMPIWETDELWLEGGKDVLAAGSAELEALEAKQAAKREKANVGKKRKAVEDTADTKAEPPAKKGKKDNKKDNKKDSKKEKGKAVPESNDNDLDKHIAAQKEKLKKQKKVAKKAMDI